MHPVPMVSAPMTINVDLFSLILMHCDPSSLIQTLDAIVSNRCLNKHFHKQYVCKWSAKLSKVFGSDEIVSLLLLADRWGLHAEGLWRDLSFSSKVYVISKLQDLDRPLAWSWLRYELFMDMFMGRRWKLYAKLSQQFIIIQSLVHNRPAMTKCLSHTPVWTDHY